MHSSPKPPTSTITSPLGTTSLSFCCCFFSLPSTPSPFFFFFFCYLPLPSQQTHRKKSKASTLFDAFVLFPFSLPKGQGAGGHTNKTKNTKQANKQANPRASSLQQSHHYPQKTTTANKHRKNNQQQHQ